MLAKQEAIRAWEESTVNIFNAEDGENGLLRNIDNSLQDYTVSYLTLNIHRRENLITYSSV